MCLHARQSWRRRARTCEKTGEWCRGLACGAEAGRWRCYMWCCSRRGATAVPQAGSRAAAGSSACRQAAGCTHRLSMAQPARAAWTQHGPAALPRPLAAGLLMTERCQTTFTSEWRGRLRGRLAAHAAVAGGTPLPAPAGVVCHAPRYCVSPRPYGLASLQHMCASARSSRVPNISTRPPPTAHAPTPLPAARLQVHRGRLPPGGRGAGARQGAGGELNTHDQAGETPPHTTPPPPSCVSSTLLSSSTICMRGSWAGL